MSNSASKKNYAIIGNCQAKGLNYFLESNSFFHSTHNCLGIFYVPDLKPDDLDNLYKNILPNIDILFIQPIRDDYYGNFKYSTKSMLMNIKKNCLVVIFPSCYFSFYHPFLKTIMNDKYNEHLIKPSWYSHDIELIRIFLYAKSDEEIITNYKYIINSPHFIKKKFLEKSFENNIKELVRRENNYPKFVPSIPNKVLHIKSSKFISENYKKKLLFYSFAHPTKYMYKFLVDTILLFLGIPLQQYPDYLDPHHDPLANNKMPLYKSIEQVIDFNIHDKNLALATMDFSKDGVLETYVRKCIDVYKKVDRNFLVETVFIIYQKLQAAELVDNNSDKWEF